MDPEQEAELRQAVRQVLNYAWDDELRDFEQKGQKDGHIFLALTVLRNWHEGLRLSADDYVFHDSIDY